MNNFDLRKYLAEGKLNENKFDVATTEKIAQAVADAFTAEDTELDLKYTVTPGTEESSFDLDVKAGPNTPGPEWKDKNGFGIENYLGDYAGGSFYIKDGVVYNAAVRNAPVANVSPEGEVEMISAADSKAAIGMEDDERYPGMYIDDEEWEREMGRMKENKYNPDLDQDDEEVPMPIDDEGRPLGESKEEKKSNKMKKSELKEMIKSAFLGETEFGDALRKRAEEESFDDAFDRIDKEPDTYPGEKTLDPDYIKETLSDTAFDMMQDIVDALGAEKAIEELVRAMSDDDALSYLEYIIRVNDINNDKEVDDIPGFEGTKDALDSLKIREAEEDEEVDVEAEETEDVEVEDTETVDVETTAEISPEVKATQDALTAAIEAAKALGDQKLADQIGNSITFFTRTHVVGQDKVAEDLTMERMLRNAGIKK